MFPGAPKVLLAGEHVDPQHPGLVVPPTPRSTQTDLLVAEHDTVAPPNLPWQPHTHGFPEPDTAVAAPSEHSLVGAPERICPLSAPHCPLVCGGAQRHIPSRQYIGTPSKVFDIIPWVGQGVFST